MNASETYTFHDYVDAFRRRRRVFLLIALPILLVAAALALLLEDEYTSSVRIEIDLMGSNVQTLETIQLTTYADQYISKLQQRVMTGDVLRALANQPGLFSPDLIELSEFERMSVVRESVGISMVTQPVLTPGGHTVDLIIGFTVAAFSPDPQFAKEVAEYIARQYLKADRNSRTERASSTTSFLRDQLSSTEREIVELELQEADFKVQNACCLPELMDLNMSVIQRAERDIESLQPRIRTLEQDRAFKQSQIDEIRQQSGANDRLGALESEYLRLVASYGSEHPDVVRVRREIAAVAGTVNAGTGEVFQLVELRMKLAEAEQRYSSEHPDIIRYKREIAALEAKQVDSGNPGLEQARLLENPRYLQLRGELNDVDTELAELRSRVPALRQKIVEFENRLTKTPQIESEYQALSRKLETARNNFENLQDRLVIAAQTEALESTAISARLREVQSAFVPNVPSGPPRVAIMIIAVFLAGSIGVGAMLIAEMTDSTIRGRKDIESIMGMVPLASIPVIEDEVGGARHWQLYWISGFAFLVVGALVLLYRTGVL